MFGKKAKTLEPLPSVPTVDEIFSDLDTFVLPAKPIKPQRKLAENESYNTQPLAEWWMLFETVVADVKELTTLKDELERKQNALQDLRSSIETEADVLRTEINEKIANINETLESYNVEGKQE